MPDEQSLSINADILRAAIVGGPAWTVRACQPPASAVMIGRDRLELQPAHPSYGRIDIVCIGVQPLSINVVYGTPASSPIPPAMPSPRELLPLAYIHRHAGGTDVLDCHIARIPEEARRA